jgi:hypothetical protein
VIDGRGTADIVGQLGLEFGDEFGVVLILCVGLTQLGEAWVRVSLAKLPP